jgi:hypothetical protein
MPWAIENANMLERANLQALKSHLQQGQAALNLVYANHGYLLNRGTEPEKQRATTERARINQVLNLIDTQLNQIENRLEGFEVLGPFDTNDGARWEEEYQESLQNPQVASHGEN